MQPIAQKSLSLKFLRVRLYHTDAGSFGNFRSVPAIASGHADGERADGQNRHESAPEIALRQAASVVYETIHLE